MDKLMSYCRTWKLIYNYYKELQAGLRFIAYFAHVKVDAKSCCEFHGSLRNIWGIESVIAYVVASKICFTHTRRGGFQNGYIFFQLVTRALFESICMLKYDVSWFWNFLIMGIKNLTFLIKSSVTNITREKWWKALGQKFAHSRRWCWAAALGTWVSFIHRNNATVGHISAPKRSRRLWNSLIHTLVMPLCSATLKGLEGFARVFSILLFCVNVWKRNFPGYLWYF